MNDIQIFKNEHFGQIRIVSDAQGEPMFCLADVCNILDLTAKTVNQRLDDEVVSKYPIFDILSISITKMCLKRHTVNKPKPNELL